MAKMRSSLGVDKDHLSRRDKDHLCPSSLTVSVRDDSTGQAHYFRVSARERIASGLAKAIHGLLRDLLAAEELLDSEPQLAQYTYPIPLSFDERPERSRSTATHHSPLATCPEPRRNRPSRLPLASCLLPRTGKAVPA